MRPLILRSDHRKGIVFGVGTGFAFYHAKIKISQIMPMACKGEREVEHAKIRNERSGL